jgi:large subunit ribosomal protein L18
MPKTREHNKIIARRAARTRSQIRGTSQRPRLSIFRSNQATYAQLIDDGAGKTIVAASTREVDLKKGLKSEKARLLGELITKKAKDQGVVSAVFDKGAYQYHGRVKAVAEGARKAGLKI